MFFDMEELVLAREHLDTTTEFATLQTGDDRKDHPEHSYACPGCQAIMKEIEYQYDSGIHIDHCANCQGIFLGASELVQINNYLDSETSPEVAARLKRGERIAEEFEKRLAAEDQNSKQAVDNLYRSDDLPGLNRVTNFLIDRFL